MPLTQIEEERNETIKKNLARMESLGLIRICKTLFTSAICKDQHNDNKIVPSKKSSREESGSEYGPLDDMNNETEESDDNLDEEDGMLQKGHIPSRSQVKASSAPQMAPGSKPQKTVRTSSQIDPCSRHTRSRSIPSVNASATEQRNEARTLEEISPCSKRAPSPAPMPSPTISTHLPRQSYRTNNDVNKGTLIMHTDDVAGDTASQFQLDNALEVVDAPRSPKKRRQETIGKGLSKLNKGLGAKMHISFVDGKRRPQQPLQAAKLASQSGVVVRNHVPIKPHWKEYKSESNTQDHLKEYMGYLAINFDMDIDNKETKDVCVDLLKNGVRQRRYRLKKKYFNGIPQNEVLRRPPPDMDAADWKLLVDKWSDQKHKETSEKNKQNRAQVKLHQTTGSRSYIAQCYSIKDSNTSGEELDAIDFFKSCHYSKKKGYSEAAQQAIDTMETMKGQTLEEGEEPKSDVNIVSEVLSGYSKSNKFLENIGIQSASSNKSMRATSSACLQQLQETLILQTESARRNDQELRATVESQREEIDGLKKLLEESDVARRKHEEEMELFRKKQAETDEILKRLLSRS